MEKLEYGILQIALVLIIVMNLNYACGNTVDLPFHSFVYCYGDAKIWVFIEANRTLVVGPKTNCTIFLTVYLEKLGDNIGVFLNRVTFKFGSKLEKAISPNATLQSSLRSWSYNVTFEQEDISPILGPGQKSSGEMNFEFRYDIIDSSGEVWSYRVNENFPLTFVNIEQTKQPWMTFEMIFVTVLLFGIMSAMVLFWLKIRRYKKKIQD